MKILISGGKGFLGSALISKLEKDGHQISILTRHPRSGPHQELPWNPEAGVLNASNLKGFEAVIHLAGESIADGRWTSAKKDRIRESRLRSTQLLSQAIGQMASPPRVFITASAIGFYGDRGEEILTEESSRGKGFLADVCSGWESSTQAAKNKNVRVAHARIGIVLGKGGGALAKMLLPFKLGVGGNLGSGRQYMSWINVDDVVGAIQFALEHDSINGPFNVTAPTPVTNREFTKTMGRVLKRPTIFPAPGFVLTVALGEMADALLLSSARVLPEKLKKAGFVFRTPELEPALRSILS